MPDPGDDGDDGDHPPSDTARAPGERDREGDDPPADGADRRERRRSGADDRPPNAGDRPPEPAERTPDATEAAPPSDPDRPDGAATGGTRRDPPPRHGGDDGSEDGGILVVLKDLARTGATVLFVGLLLFAISGVWPPLVAVESGSMEPHMYKGDLVFIVEEGRFAPGDATEGVVTYRQGVDSGYWSFGNHGNVVVYTPHVQGFDGEYRVKSPTPIIHRAMFYVEKGQNWVAMANESHLGGADTCEEVSTCPANVSGFVTKGDNNAVYDQVGRGEATAIVKREWIRGVAKFRIPWLGCVRLQLSGDSCF
jgi:signal peptidase